MKVQDTHITEQYIAEKVHFEPVSIYYDTRRDALFLTTLMPYSRRVFYILSEVGESADRHAMSSQAFLSRQVGAGRFVKVGEL